MKKCNLIIIIFAISLNYSFSQWIQTNGPYNSGISNIVTIDSSIFVSTANGVFLSNNKGTSWTSVNNGLSGSYFCLASDGINLFAGSDSGAFLSIDKGISWSNINNNIINLHPYSLAINGGNIYTVTYDNHLYISANNGNSWIIKTICPTNVYAYRIAANNSIVIAGTTNGVYLSTNNCNTWSHSTNGIPSIPVNSITFNGNDIYVGTNSGGIFLSSDNGISWTSVSNGIPEDNNVSSIYCYSSNIFAGIGQFGVFLSKDNGNQWAAWNTGGLSYLYINAFAILDSTIYAGDSYGYIWKRPLSELIKIEEIYENNNIIIYSNSNILNIEFKQYSISNESRIVIYDLQGRLLLNEEIHSEKTQINISRLTKGIYVLKLNGTHKVEVRKFIKE